MGNKLFELVNFLQAVLFADLQIIVKVTLINHHLFRNEL